MKKNQAVLVFLIQLLCFAAIGQKVTVYSNDFNGIDAALGPGKYDNITLVRQGVAVVRSVRVPAGMQVTLYEKDNFQGTSLVLWQDANMKLLQGKGFGQVAQNISIVVEVVPESRRNEPVAIIYRDNFSGASLNLREGYYDHYELGGVDNDQLSSVKVPKDMKVTLYEHGGYSGRSLVITADASADFLIKKKFNDITSSIRVEKVTPEPEPVVTTPPVVIVPVVVPEPKPEPKPQDTEATLSVMIFQGNFSGTSKRLEPGRYRTNELGIGDDELSSVQIPADMRVTLFEKDNFAGRSLLLTEGVTTERITELGFNNLTSSMIVEVIPRVSVYQGNFGDVAFRLKPGKYDIVDMENLGLLDNEVSSVKVPKGMSVILFDEFGFKGRAVYLTNDASTDSLIAKKFNNVTSSIQVNEIEENAKPEMKITIYQDNFTGKSKTLGVGNYDHAELGIDNNTLSAVNIPRGLRVTLYEHGAFEGRSMTLTKSAGDAFFNQNNFNDVTSSIKVEAMNPDELVVTIYSDSFSGRGQKLGPGRYYTRDITIGDKQLSSVRVPKGMLVTLYADWNCEGLSVVLDRDEDFTGSKQFDNFYRSMEVEDVRQPFLQTPPTTQPAPAPEPTPAPTPEPDVVVEPSTSPTGNYNYDVPCKLNDDQYQNALRAIQSKPFRDEKMEMTMLVTKGKCLTNDQIRGIAREFSFEEQTLDFIKYAYDKALEKDTYYLLENVFKFMSSKEGFRKFLKEKGE